jgi:hypothetical protein
MLLRLCVLLKIWVLLLLLHAVDAGSTGTTLVGAAISLVAEFVRQMTVSVGVGENGSPTDGTDAEVGISRGLLLAELRSESTGTEAWVMFCALLLTPTLLAVRKFAPGFLTPSVLLLLTCALLLVGAAAELAVLSICRLSVLPGRFAVITAAAAAAVASCCDIAAVRIDSGGMDGSVRSFSAMYSDMATQSSPCTATASRSRSSCGIKTNMSFLFYFDVR